MARGDDGEGLSGGGLALADRARPRESPARCRHVEERQRAEEFCGWVRLHQQAVWLFCRQLGDPDAADDLAQETFVRAYQALPRFRGDSSPRNWLLAIARRVCADHVRARVRSRRLTARLEQVGPLPSRDSDDPAEQVGVWDAIAGLSSERRSAFVLTQLFGFSYQDAAEVCGCPVGTVRSRVARARDDLIRARAHATRDALSG